MYKEFKNRASSRIVYLGNLNYYQDTGEDELLTVDGLEVKRAETVNAIAQTSSLTNVPADVLKNAKACKTNRDPEIIDPFEYAKSINGEDYVAKPDDWCNNWENYMSFEKMSDYKYYSNLTFSGHCGPTTILNLVLSYKNRYGITGINSLSKRDIFLQIAQFGINNGYYEITGGTSDAASGNYIKGVFSMFGKNIAVSSLYNIQFENIKTRLKDNDLIYFSVNSHNIYGTHIVVCYAYCRLVSTKTGWYKTFYKVADGWNSSGRYIDVGTATNGHYRYINL